VTTARPKPASTRAAKPATKAAAVTAPPIGDDLDAAILRALRRTPNRVVDLGPLASELGVEPSTVQLAVERLARRRMVVLPFVEPGTAGGAELAAAGLRWLIAREGGTPKDTPVAFQSATGRVRAEAEGARLPRADVYGPRR
jgi:hypothetical protein